MKLRELVSKLYEEAAQTEEGHEIEVMLQVFVDDSLENVPDLQVKVVSDVKGYGLTYILLHWG